MAQANNLEPGGEIYDAMIKVLFGCAKHHVKQAQNEIFPKAKSVKLAMIVLGAQLAARKRELLADLLQALRARRVCRAGPILAVALALALALARTANDAQRFICRSPSW